jgi:hypothetical protein
MVLTKRINEGALLTHPTNQVQSWKDLVKKLTKHNTHHTQVQAHLGTRQGIQLNNKIVGSLL